MTDNIEAIKQYMIKEQIPILEKDIGDLFFLIMLIRRGKDHPNLPSANYTFKSYYIDSIEKLNKCQDEIIKCCDLFKLRAYVSINAKSKEKFAKLSSLNFTQNIYNNEYKKPWAILNHSFGCLPCKNNHKWLVDIDDNTDINSEYVKQICKIIQSCDSTYNNLIISHFKTKSGLHLITHPFNLKQFNDLCKEENLICPDVKKDHITLLYENI